MPYLEFVDGDVLTAAQLNTYLSRQVVLRYASAATRDAALAGILAPGLVTYLQDVDAYEFYSTSLTWKPAFGAVNLYAERATDLTLTASYQTVVSITVAAGTRYKVEAGTFINGLVNNSGSTPAPPDLTWTSVPSGASGWFYTDWDGGGSNGLLTRTSSPTNINSSTNLALGDTWVENNGTTYGTHGLLTFPTAGNLTIGCKVANATGVVKAKSYILARPF